MTTSPRPRVFYCAWRVPSCTRFTHTLHGLGHAHSTPAHRSHLKWSRGHALSTPAHRSQGQHVMAIELGKPSDITGAPFTSVFATHSGSDDLSVGWTFLDPHTHVYPPLVPVHGYEGACPTIRYVAATDHYYLITLHGIAGGYGEFLVRSKDLTTWESAKANPMLDFHGEVAADKGAAPRKAAWNYYANFTADMEDYIAKGECVQEPGLLYLLKRAEFVNRKKEKIRVACA
jgi:hypothetical protein